MQLGGAVKNQLTKATAAGSPTNVPIRAWRKAGLQPWAPLAREVFPYALEPASRIGPGPLAVRGGALKEIARIGLQKLQHQGVGRMRLSPGEDALQVGLHLDNGESGNMGGVQTGGEELGALSSGLPRPASPVAAYAYAAAAPTTGPSDS